MKGTIQAVSSPAPPCLSSPPSFQGWDISPSYAGGGAQTGSPFSLLGCCAGALANSSFVPAVCVPPPEPVVTYGQRIRPSFSILCHRGYYRKSSEVHHGDRQVLEELLLEIQIFCTCGRRSPLHFFRFPLYLKSLSLSLSCELVPSIPLFILPRMGIICYCLPLPG